MFSEKPFEENLENNIELNSEKQRLEQNLTELIANTDKLDKLPEDRFTKCLQAFQKHYLILVGAVATVGGPEGFSEKISSGQWEKILIELGAGAILGASFGSTMRKLAKAYKETYDK